MARNLIQKSGLICFALALGLTACGGNTPPTAVPSPIPSTTPTASAAPKNAATSAATRAAAPVGTGAATQASSGGPASGPITAQGSDTVINLSWQPVPNAQGYRLYRDGELINPTPVKETAYQDIGLTNGRSYTYNLSALDSAGNSGPTTQPLTAVPHQ